MRRARQMIRLQKPGQVQIQYIYTRDVPICWMVWAIRPNVRRRTSEATKLFNLKKEGPKIAFYRAFRGSSDVARERLELSTLRL